MDLEQIIVKPIVTEKSVTHRQKGVYVFKVLLDANKIQVKQAVEKMFKVKVKGVNTTFIRGKRRVVGRSAGTTSRWKKAYVTLESGQKIQEIEA
ncbi:MAG: 50S ribosomal protein L23 [Candidatus Margulisiibacteriota bacterium]